MTRPQDNIYYLKPFEKRLKNACSFKKICYHIRYFATDYQSKNLTIKLIVFMETLVLMFSKTVTIIMLFKRMLLFSILNVLLR